MDTFAENAEFEWMEEKESVISDFNSLKRKHHIVSIFNYKYFKRDFFATFYIYTPLYMRNLFSTFYFAKHF